MSHEKIARVCNLCGDTFIGRHGKCEQCIYSVRMMNSGVSDKRRKHKVAFSIVRERIELEMEILHQENLDATTATFSDIRLAGIMF